MLADLLLQETITLIINHHDYYWAATRADLETSKRARERKEKSALVYGKDITVIRTRMGAVFVGPTYPVNSVI